MSKFEQNSALINNLRDPTLNYLETLEINRFKRYGVVLNQSIVYLRERLETFYLINLPVYNKPVFLRSLFSDPSLSETNEK